MVGAGSESQVVLSLRLKGRGLETTAARRAGVVRLPTTMNGRLRTGADKGNPTV